MRKNERSAVRHLLELLGIGCALAYMFLFANWNSSEDVTLRFWFANPALTLKVVYPVLGSFLAGFLFATFFWSLGAVQGALELRTLRRRLRGLQAEILRLHAAPDDELDEPPPDRARHPLRRSS